MRKVDVRRMLIAQGLGWILDHQRQPIWVGKPRPSGRGKPVPAPEIKSELPLEVKGSNGRTYRLNAIGQYQRVHAVQPTT